MTKHRHTKNTASVFWGLEGEGDIHLIRSSKHWTDIAVNVAITELAIKSITRMNREQMGTSTPLGYIILDSYITKNFPDDKKFYHTSREIGFNELHSPLCVAMQTVCLVKDRLI